MPRDYNDPKYRKKISESAKRRANTPEGKERMLRTSSLGGKASEGRKRKQWEKDNISDAMKKYYAENPIPQSTKDKISASNTGRKPSLESIEKTASKLRGRKRGPLSIEQKNKISNTLKSKSEHLSKKAKEWHAKETDEEKQKRLANWIEAGRKNVERMIDGTTIEAYVENELIKQGIEYKTQQKVGWYLVDFIIEKKYVIIEANGCYWHGCEQCGFNDENHVKKRQNELVREQRLQKRGYTVITVWEHEIRDALKTGAAIPQLIF